MNDFTKEELQSMIEVMDELYFGKFYAKDEYPKLYSKINSMIDNYCEHEWVNGAYCEKCNKSPTE